MWFYAVYLRVNGLTWSEWSQSCTKMILPFTWTDVRDQWIRLMSSKWKTLRFSADISLIVGLAHQYVVIRFVVLFWTLF